MRQRHKSPTMISDEARLSRLLEGAVSYGPSKLIRFSDRAHTWVERAVRTLGDRLSKTAHALSSLYSCAARSRPGVHPAILGLYASIDQFTAAIQRGVTSALQPEASHP